MKIDFLISLKKNTPLSEIVKHIDAEAYLGNSLYKIEAGIYFYLTKFGVGAGGGPKEESLSGLYMAPDDGAILRATAYKIEEDSGSKLTVPIGFFPQNLNLEYGCILEWLKNMRPRVCRESATYRIASDGLFVHRKIETEKYTIYFREKKHNNRERPYAILYKY